ncbi:MAG: D-glucuronyl C5-epimerase family protein [Desulfobacula sp.]|nr:D-glucuronyl C5-epimerase family protein [Desulfobacula sp.]
MKLLIKNQLFFLILALIFSIFLSNYTHSIFDKPAIRILKIATGGDEKNFEIDQDGIPKVFYPKLKEAFYNPVYISHKAIAFYENFKTSKKDSESVKSFIKYSIWLKNNLRIMSYGDLTYGIWEYHFAWPNYRLTPPWRSGMAQGAGIKVLHSAFEVTGDETFLVAAKYALTAFMIEVKNGGVTYKDSPDEWWFEEYAGGNNLESRVLNGAIYALIDIYEFWENTGNEDAKKIYNLGLNSIRKNLEKYDAGWWSYYDLTGTIATQKYHNVHIELLKRLYDITGETFFLKYNEKWSHYNTSYFIREFIRQRPDYHDLVILGLNFLCVLIIEYMVVGFYFSIKRIGARKL